ncbi:MAG TPA: XdhC family protein, partial [Beijerinckiaceae bacterium]
MRLALLSALNVERAARRACVLVTDLESGDQRLVKAQDMADDALAEPLDAAVRAGKSGSVEHEGRSYFLNVQVPPVRLVAIGAVHITQALAPMAKLAGFDLTIVDPRTAFATPSRFPNVRLLAEWPQNVLAEMGL